MGEEAIEAEVWRLESNEWADLGHPEKLKPKHKEAKAKNPLFISNPSRVSGIGDNRYWNLRIWIPGTLPKSVQFPHTSRKLRFVPGHGKQRISRLGMPGWMPCWKGRGDEMNSCIQDAKTFTPPSPECWEPGLYSQGRRLEGFPLGNLTSSRGETWGYRRQSFPN